MKEDVTQKAKFFDSEGKIKHRIEDALNKLKDFRKKYPFTENPATIENLTPEDIFKEDTNEIGEFFHYIEFHLKALGALELKGSATYRNITAQLEDFKELLHIAVDKNKSLEEKVNAPWQEIKGLGGDRHIAKKIIFCFNYERDAVVPIFSTSHLEHFLNIIQETSWQPIQYYNMNLGEKYEILTEELIKSKESSPVTKPWEITYFCRFLYETYVPPKITTTTQHKKLHEKEARERQQQFSKFINLLNQLKKEGKITAEQWRAYSKQWQERVETRQILTEELKQLI